jgi:hypothetical protein
MPTPCKEEDQIPVLMTCGCDLGLFFQYISTTQHCDLNPCGFVPGYNTQAKYNKEGNCISPANTHSPQLGNDRGSNCWPQRYLKKTTEDTSGLFRPNGSHGNIFSEEFTYKRELDSNGFETKEPSCEYKSSCSGSTTITVETKCKGGFVDNELEFEYAKRDSETNTTVTTVTTYNKDCSTTQETTCSGTSSDIYESWLDISPDGSLESDYNCESTYQADCTWSGSQTYSNNYSLSPPGTVQTITDSLDSPCECHPAFTETTVTTTIEPSPNCTVTYDYGDPTPKRCTPTNFLEFPEYALRGGETFNGSKAVCLADGQESVPVPDLKTGPCKPWPNVHGLTECFGGPSFVTGQGRSNVAFKFVNPYESDIVSERKVKARLTHSGGTPCYLKVWIRKVIQKYKWEDCATGFPGDPKVPSKCHKGTPSLPACKETTNSEGRTNFDCRSRWSTDGPPEKEDFQEYEWNGDPCLKDKCQPPSSCFNYVDQEYDITAANGTTVYIEYKYSYVKDYEPNWPDVCGSQGCKPNGYPIYQEGSEQCPKYDPSKPAQCYETQLINNRPVTVCVPCNDCGPNF